LALEIELETTNHWWIFETATYHDSFFNNWVDPDMAIPTQVAGAVGEALAVLAMEKLWGARLVDKVTPHPSSRSADFWMQLDSRDGSLENILVESKATNARGNSPSRATVTYALSQLLDSQTAMERDGIRIQRLFVIITAFRARTLFVVEVT
jgi:hypothetical protein